MGRGLPWNQHARQGLAPPRLPARVNRTRQGWRTAGFFRFPPLANAMADELPTCPGRRPLLTSAQRIVRQFDGLAVRRGLGGALPALLQAENGYGISDPFAFE